jgi:hypothetical protein
MRKVVIHQRGGYDRIRLLPSTSIPFDSVADAHRTLESGDTVGEIVLTM